ncbi:MAG TPA: saccharopine dehydrogenase NADP-binding domain-containing protein [Thermoanaerobaculia bacterium]|nr:saccharopine dehydrogenase NADP-binding domain-containing protein [Thermoanaerobaculia bacterium]
MNWLIYGANGYTGELIAREAARRGMRPILAGRSAERIDPLASELGLESRVFSVTHPNLHGVDLVLHCAGPFIRTAEPMVRACLDKGAHYFDITGEIDVFESILARNDEAVRRGVVLIPGVGFDVVPTDCLGAMLAKKLPDANELWLAFATSRGGISRGTKKTMIESAGDGGAIRRDGKIVRVPLLFDVRTIPFASGPRLALTIPWGDVATAYHTTGIPNVRVYNATSPETIKKLRWSSKLLPLMRIGFIKRALQKRAERHPGPSAERRAQGRTDLWGRVANAKGDEVTMTMSTPEGYTLTVLTALAAIDRLTNEQPRPGAYTPARYFGAEFITTIDGVTVT